jgi:hypothetical protein
MTPVKPQYTLDALRGLPAKTEWVACKKTRDDGHRTKRRWHDG